jgi:hypothetical protein
VDSAALAYQSEDGLCELETGDGISSETCRRLSCDASHVTAAEDERGNIRNMGRKARKISTPLWRALVSRDRGKGHSRLSRTLSHPRGGRRDPERGEPEVGVELSAQTVDSFWDGERMDLHMAVDGVFNCEDDPMDEQ